MSSCFSYPEEDYRPFFRQNRSRLPKAAFCCSSLILREADRIAAVLLEQQVEKNWQKDTEILAEQIFRCKLWSMEQITGEDEDDPKTDCEDEEERDCRLF